MTGVAARFGSWAAGLTLPALPPDVTHAAQRAILDVTGVALAGSKTTVATMIRDHALAVHGAGPCQVIGSGRTISALGAALANGAGAHALDFDDTCYAGVVHGSAVVFPAVLAAAQLEDISGDDLVAAFVAGCEVEFALGRVFADGTFRWWTTAMLGVVGAAAGAARALRLDAEMTAGAIRIAAAQASGMRRVFGTPAKPYLCGRTAMTGLDAALASRAGISGPDRVFEADDGFFAKFVSAPLGRDAFDGIGRRFGLIDPGITFKLFPLCSAAQAAVEATIGLLADHGITGDAVTAVQCDVTPFVAGCLSYARPITVAQAQFSMPFAIGCILADGRLDLGSLDQARLDDGRLARSMAKVTMAPVAELARAAEQRLDELEAATVSLTLSDGRVVTRHLGAATGMPTRPASDDQLRAKFRACAVRALAPGGVEDLLHRLDRLAELKSARDLLQH